MAHKGGRRSGTMSLFYLSQTGKIKEIKLQ